MMMTSSTDFVKKMFLKCFLSIFLEAPSQEMKQRSDIESYVESARIFTIAVVCFNENVQSRRFTSHSGL